MPKTIAMQEFLAMMGATGFTLPIIQPFDGAVDAQQAMEAIFDVQIIEGHTGLTLALETATAGQGPWRAIREFNTYSLTQAAVYATSREGGGTQFERFLRWKLDRSSLAAEAWRTCFKICVTLK